MPPTPKTTPRSHERRAPGKPHSGTAAPLDTLSPARRAKAERAASDEDVFGLFYQEGYETAGEHGKADAEEREAAARRGAYRAGKADARKPDPNRALARAEKTPADSGGGMKAPNLRPPVLFAEGIDRTTSARVIVVCVTVAGIGAVGRDVFASKSAPQKLTVDVGGGKTLVIPNHLHSLAGVLIVGVIALVVNEFQPQIGLALAVLLLLDVGIQIFAGDAGLAKRLAGGLITTGKAQSLKDQIANMPPGSISKSDPGGGRIVKPKSGLPYRLVPIPGKPGQYSQEPLLPSEGGTYNPGYATA